MKPFLLILSSFLLLKASCQEVKANFDGKKWEASYVLDTIKGGDIERFLIPIEFAPSISYKGVEDIRFTAGWSKKETKEYWSYAFLWYIDGYPAFDSKIIENNLVAYYTGLIKINVDSTKLDVNKTPVKVSVKKLPSKGGVQNFEATVSMIDFLTLQPITLNLRIHINYKKELDKTFVFHEASPQSFDSDVWKTLDALWTRLKYARE